MADGELNGVGPGCDDPADGAEEGEGGLLGAGKREAGRGKTRDRGWSSWSSWPLHAASRLSVCVLPAAGSRPSNAPKSHMSWRVANRAHA